MKRIYPERSYGKFICCDGLQHEWFVPVIKSFIHYIKIFCLHRNPTQKDIAQLTMSPLFQKYTDEPCITWLGHSTFLIQMAGKNILTDPIFGSLSFVFRRLIRSVVKMEDLPPIDYVVISHNHFDHMDRQALCRLKELFPQMRVLVPFGDKEWFERHLFTHVSEHMWWDEIFDKQSVGNGSTLKFTFLPANHWSQRTLFDKNRSLWGSWMIQVDDYKIYFAGDTSWGFHFEQIGQEFKQIDVALLPIAPGEPKSLMQSSHINAQDAIKAFIKLKAKTLIPMHWGTFHLGFDEFHAPIDLLKKTWLQFNQELHNKDLRVLKFGEMFIGLKYKIALIAQSKSKHLSF